MPSRTTIWLRDAFVVIFAIYVVFSIAMVPWSNLKISESSPSSCEWTDGCPPTTNFPEHNYHHYDDSLTFNWNSVSVTYHAIIIDSDSADEESEMDIIHSANLTDSTSTTSPRLKVGNYTSIVYYTGMFGSVGEFGNPIIFLKFKSETHQLDSSSKITLDWNKVNVTYTLQIREYRDTDVPIIHEVNTLSETVYEYSNFVEGKEYSWSVFAVDGFGFTSEPSSQNDLRIGTTKFLAFMLFNEWELPFLLLGIMMVIALQAGVFLAREEKDD